MQFIVVLIVGWFTDWLVSHVAGLDANTARQVAQVLVDHTFGVAVTLVATGWYWFRRPGDLPAKIIEDYRDLLKVGIDPAAPASAAPVKAGDPRG